MSQGPRKAVRKKVVDPYKLEVAGRIYDAFTAASRKRARGNELTQDEVGRRVARELGLADPIQQATVSRWLSNRDPTLPDPLTLRAIATVLEVDTMWLLFGGTTD